MYHLGFELTFKSKLVRLEMSDGTLVNITTRHDGLVFPDTSDKPSGSLAFAALERLDRPTHTLSSQANDIRIPHAKLLARLADFCGWQNSSAQKARLT
jgi:hypothetical protein